MTSGYGLFSSLDFQNPHVVVKGTFFFCSPHVRYSPGLADPSRPRARKILPYTRVTQLEM